MAEDAGAAALLSVLLQHAGDFQAVEQVFHRLARRAYEHYGPGVCRKKAIAGLLADGVLEDIGTDLSRRGLLGVESSWTEIGLNAEAGDGNVADATAPPSAESGVSISRDADVEMVDAAAANAVTVPTEKLVEWPVPDLAMHAGLLGLSLAVHGSYQEDGTAYPPGSDDEVVGSGLIERELSTHPSRLLAISRDNEMAGILPGLSAEGNASHSTAVKHLPGSEQPSQPAPSGSNTADSMRDNGLARPLDRHASRLPDYGVLKLSEQQDVAQGGRTKALPLQEPALDRIASTSAVERRKNPYQAAFKSAPNAQMLASIPISPTSAGLEPAYTTSAPYERKRKEYEACERMLVAGSHKRLRLLRDECGHGGEADGGEADSADASRDSAQMIPAAAIQTSASGRSSQPSDGDDDNDGKQKCEEGTPAGGSVKTRRRANRRKNRDVRLAAQTTEGVAAVGTTTPVLPAIPVKVTPGATSTPAASRLVPSNVPAPPAPKRPSKTPFPTGFDVQTSQNRVWRRLL